MKYKYFAFDEEAGFETFETEVEATEYAEECIQCYRDNAGEGWAEMAANVCWGKIEARATEFKTGTKGMFEGELVDFVDYKLEKLKHIVL